MDMKLAMTATEDVFCLYKSAMYKDVCERLSISTEPHMSNSLNCRGSCKADRRDKTTLLHSTMTWNSLV